MQNSGGRRAETSTSNLRKPTTRWGIQPDAGGGCVKVRHSIGRWPLSRITSGTLSVCMQPLCSPRQGG